MKGSKQLLVKKPQEEQRLLNGFCFLKCQETLVVDREQPDCSAGCTDKNVEKVHKIDEDQ